MPPPEARGLAARRLRAMLTLPLQPPIYRMVLRVYVPILFPLTALLVWLGTLLDRRLGWEPWPAPPWNWALLVLCETLGLAWVAWCYSYLVHDGGGSPAPFLGRTRRLIVDGPYRLVRNPSVWGKLLGVLGVGFAARTPGFLLVVVPLLVGGSIAEKWLRQEPVLVEVFGERYLAYRRRVPIFLPRPGDVWRMLTGRLDPWPGG